jgi:hypothetical protein
MPVNGFFAAGADDWVPVGVTFGVDVEPPPPPPPHAALASSVPTAIIAASGRRVWFM